LHAPPKELRCPVLLNGNVFSAAQAQQLLAETERARPDDRAAAQSAIRGCSGQIRAQCRGEKQMPAVARYTATVMIGAGNFRRWSPDERSS